MNFLEPHLRRPFDHNFRRHSYLTVPTNGHLTFHWHYFSVFQNRTIYFNFDFVHLCIEVEDNDFPRRESDPELSTEAGSEGFIFPAHTVSVQMIPAKDS